MRTLKRIAALGLAAATAFAGAAANVNPALAHADELTLAHTVNNLPGNFAGNFGDFYQEPTSFPKEAGKVIRTQDFKGLFVSPKGKNTQYPLTGKRVMYTSTTSNGLTIPTTGALLNPTGDWTGKGENPLVVLAPGTLGQGPPMRSLQVYWFTSDLQFLPRQAPEPGRPGSVHDCEL
ncbi:MAG: hypothetical protein WAN89_08185 [Lawsonella sp.]|nr:hypothetical protein [Mycobacteriales bacterium]